MKTNVDKLYKTDSNLEKTGVWFELSDEIAFLVKRFGGANQEAVKRASAKYHRPYAQRINKGTLDAKTEKEVMFKAFIKSCILDWRGVEIDGKLVDYDFDIAVKFFCELPDLMVDLIEYASAVESYKEDLGNS